MDNSLRGVIIKIFGATLMASYLSACTHYLMPIGRMPQPEKWSAPSKPHQKITLITRLDPKCPKNGSISTCMGWLDAGCQ